MKTKLSGLLVLALLTGLDPQLSTFAQGTAFTYQGRLNDGVAPASGSYDLLFTLLDAPSGGAQIGPVITNAAIGVSNGLFTVALDFGNVFDGSPRWLEIGVRTNGSPAEFLPLNPRQPFTPAPYALYAANAGLQANAVTTDKIADGTIAVADLSPVLASNTFWRLGGNSGTSAGTHFVGTTDDEALEIKVNGARALRLEPKYCPNVIGGGESNAVNSGAVGATIAGGGAWWEPNTVSGNYGAIGGGRNNRASSFETVIAGGRGNLANGGSSAIGGGYVNTASGDYATVPGGSGNVASNSYASALGDGCTAGGVGALAAGVENLASGDASVALGSATKATGPNSVALGRSSEARGLYSTAIGEATTASGRASIAMGSGTTASGDYSLVGGGQKNCIYSNAFSSTISGGSSNAVYGYASSIAGGELNIIQVTSDHSTIGGGGFNSIAGSERYALYSTVSGGFANRVETNSSYVLIGGGYGNAIQADAAYSTIGGGIQNTIQSNARTCVIAGGGLNTVESNVWRSTISGGRYNTIKAPAYHATISGGTYNTNAGTCAVVPGGDQNYAGGTSSFAAGHRAKANYQGDFVWADSQDVDFNSTANDQFLIRATGGVGIGVTNPTTALEVAGDVKATAFQGDGSGLTGITAATLGGQPPSAFWQLGGNSGSTPGANFLGTADNQPLELKVNGVRALRLEPTSVSPNLVGGFSGNSVDAGKDAVVIAGGGRPGAENRAGAELTVIGGGWANTNNGAGGALAGGKLNRIETGAYDSALSGGQRNVIQSNAFRATLSGGLLNLISNGAAYATIAGGQNNQAGGSEATVAGGAFNSALGFSSAVGGGGANTAGGEWSVVVGGRFNTASGNYSTAMGRLTTAANDDATAMGFGCTASGWDSVAMGNHSVAGAHYSLAAGCYSQATNQGAFVWSDSSSTTPFSSTAANQFCVRAVGGVILDNSTSVYLGSQTRQMLNLWGSAYGIGVQSGSLYFRCDNAGVNDGFSWYKGGVHSDYYANAGGGVELMHLTAGGLWVNGTFVSASDRNTKENFKTVDPRAVLDKVAALPLSEWNYKQDAATRHLGPMAQDFYAAFGVGPDDKHIATVDADGVALAAIQGLNQKIEIGKQKAESRMERLETENAELKRGFEQKETEVMELKQRLEQLERLMNHKQNGEAQ